jgi:3-deoxy-manno-octulosonate cytidylyltransferase (CMP-KDO synthetase)
MKIIGIIPSRFASSRLPAKALADINGKSVVQRVYEQASKAKKLNKVVVATDHEQIYEHVKSFGGEVVMTVESHQSGTDRCFEALSKQTESFDYVINIQGDEPFIDPQMIDTLAEVLSQDTELATLIKKLEKEEDLFNENVVKVIFNAQNQAIYFSRAAIPHQRNTPQNEWLNKRSYYKHIGIYAYRSDVLKSITTLPPSGLEMAESLEQLRWIENGHRIKVSITELESLGIDTPEDLEKARKRNS